MRARTGRTRGISASDGAKDLRKEEGGGHEVLLFDSTEIKHCLALISQITVSVCER